jgi:hypothetical protein
MTHIVSTFFESNTSKLTRPTTTVSGPLIASCASGMAAVTNRAALGEHNRSRAALHARMLGALARVATATSAILRAGLRPHETCGGRSLNDEVMDTLYNVIINAEKGPRITEGIKQATKPAAKTFPFLQPPNPPIAEERVAMLSKLVGRPTEPLHHHHAQQPHPPVG